MTHYISLQSGEKIPIVGAVSFSTGDGLDLTQRYGYDYSRSPQSLVHRRRTTALTASMNMSFNNSMCVEAGAVSIYRYVEDLHNAVGSLVELVWNGRNFGKFIVVSAQFSASVDAAQVFPAMSVSMAFTEGFVRRETTQTAVGTIEKPE